MGDLQAFKNILDHMTGADAALRYLVENPDVREKVSEYCRKYGYPDYLSDAVEIRRAVEWYAQYFPLVESLKTETDEDKKSDIQVEIQVLNTEWSIETKRPIEKRVSWERMIRKTLETIRDDFDRLGAAVPELMTGGAQPRRKIDKLALALAQEKPEAENNLKKYLAEYPENEKRHIVEAHPTLRRQRMQTRLNITGFTKSSYYRQPK